MFARRRAGVTNSERAPNVRDTIARSSTATALHAGLRRFTPHQGGGEMIGRRTFLTSGAAATGAAVLDAPSVIAHRSPMARKVHASFTKFQLQLGVWDHVSQGAYHQFLKA
jgi:hypothetical protein